MHFLNPGYLWALPALLVPLVVHLFNLQRSERVVFANTRMLEHLVRQTTKARNLRHLFLLFLRMLAMACIILAFAQPVTSESGMQLDSGIASINIYIDNSPSMAIQEAEGNALDRAIAFASSLPSRFAEKGWFRLNDNNNVSGRTWTSAASFRDQTLGVQKAPASKNLSTILSQTYRQFSARSTQGKKHLFILSDFQKGFFAGANDPTFDSSVVHHFVRLGHGLIPNIWIDSAWTDSRQDEGNSKTTLFFRIRSASLSESKPCRIQLFEGSGLQAGISLEVKPGLDNTGRISLNSTGQKRRLLKLEINDPAYPADNSFFIILKSADPLKVHSLAEKSNLVLKKLFASSAAVRFSESSFQNPDYAVLDESDLLILDKPAGFSESIRERIKHHLSEGKSVCIIPFSKSFDGIRLEGIMAGEAYRLPENVAGPETGKILLPGSESSFYRSAFRDPGRNPILPEASPFLDISSLGFPILRFESGRSFLSQIPSGAGNLFLFSGDPSEPGFSFHRHPLMLPTFFRMAAIAVKSNSSKLFESRNQQSIVLNLDSGLTESEGRIELRNGTKSVLAGLARSGKNLIVNADLNRMEEGFWEVVQNGKRIDAFALNRSAEESFTEFSSAEELKNTLPSKPWIKLEEIGQTANQEHLKAGVNSGFAYWKMLLIAGICLLAAEAFFLRRMPFSTSSST